MQVLEGMNDMHLFIYLFFNFIVILCLKFIKCLMLINYVVFLKSFTVNLIFYEMENGIDQQFSTGGL